MVISCKMEKQNVVLYSLLKALFMYFVFILATKIKSDIFRICVYISTFVCLFRPFRIFSFFYSLLYLSLSQPLCVPLSLKLEFAQFIVLWWWWWFELLFFFVTFFGLLFRIHLFFDFKISECICFVIGTEFRMAHMRFVGRTCSF